MKLAVSGKGGVGKTTFAALMIRTLNAEGKRVLAIDADPDANLAAGIGIADADKIIPIAEMEDLVFERTGAKPGSIGGYFKLNPKVDDLPDEISVKFDGIKLMRLGGIKKGGSGCICPESSLLRALVMHIVLARDLYPEKLEGDEPEALDVVPWNINDLRGLTAREDCTEGRSIAALYIARDYLAAEENEE